MPISASDDIDVLEKAKRLLAPDYVPSEDEEYMNERQQAYFRMLLIEWKLYSVELNRIEKQVGFPDEITWPVAPGAAVAN